MKIFAKVPNINFMAVRKRGLIASLILTAAALLLLLTRGLNLGIDFTGGVLVEVAYPQTIELEKVRADLSKAGYEHPVVQYFGGTSDVLIRLPPSKETNQAKISTAILDALGSSTQG